MKKLFGLMLSLMVIFGNCKVANANVIYSYTTDKTYITLDKIEFEDNSVVIKDNFNLYNFKAKADYKKQVYTLTFNSKKNATKTKKLVKAIAHDLHGTEIEKRFREYRTYKIVVKAKAKNGKWYKYTINEHKIK